MAPSAKMSLRASAGLAFTCSGDMYPSVPMTTPGSVAVGKFVASAVPSACVSLARPKSRILTRPSLVTKTFSGFRSRWTMPFSCAAARPWAIWIAYSIALRGENRPPASSERSVSPSSSSWTTYGAPSAGFVPRSWTAVMLGWLSRPAARASCSKRFRRSASLEKAGGRTLIATSRPRRGSLARYTSPIPPAPRGERIS